MSITRLTLTDFRNHAATRLDELASMNVLTGDNGAGKTNILEALSLLGPGRGLRAAQADALARRDGAGGFAVAARLGRDEDSIALGTGTRADQPGRRTVRINGATASQSGLGEYLAVNWLTPAHDRLFVDGAGVRRRYLDRLTAAIRPGHLGYVQDYEGAMRERNRLLSEDRADGRPVDPLWLDALEDRMARYAGAIISGRQELVDRLESLLDAAETGVFAKPRLSMASEQGAKQDFREFWKHARKVDRAAGRTLAGPHRDDLAVEMRQSGEQASLCSTGQQKAMLIALTLTHGELLAESRPRLPTVLLLDEVAAHLDAQRRAALFEQLAMRPMQVWMTGTDKSLFEALPPDSRHFVVANGAVIS